MDEEFIALAANQIFLVSIFCCSAFACLDCRRDRYDAEICRFHFKENG